MRLGLIFRNFKGYAQEEADFLENLGYTSLEQAVLKFYKETRDIDCQRVYSQTINKLCTSVIVRTGVSKEKGPKTIRPVIAYLDVAIYPAIMEQGYLHDGYCFMIDGKVLQNIEGKFVFAKNLAEVLKDFDEAQKIQSDITKIFDSYGLK